MKVKIGGVPVHVLSPEECEKCDVVVCTPVAGYPVPPVPGAIKVACSRCDQLCWLALSSPVKPPKICIPCLIKQQHAERLKKVEAGQMSLSE